MCNIDRILEYSAVKIVIDHEKDDRLGKNLICYCKSAYL